MKNIYQPIKYINQLPELCLDNTRELALVGRNIYKYGFIMKL